MVSLLPPELAQSLLCRATASILQSTGFVAAAPSAQLELARAIEDYLLRLLQRTLKYANAARRTRPSVGDVELMMDLEGIRTADLEDEMFSSFALAGISDLPRDDEAEDAPAEAAAAAADVGTRALLGRSLDGATDKRPYIPPYLPSFPAKHTYLRTPSYLSRPSSPQTIRELATEQAALAETALLNMLRAEKESRAAAAAATSTTTAAGTRNHREDVWRRTWQEMGFDSDVLLDGVANWEADKQRPKRVR